MSKKSNENVANNNTPEDEIVNPIISASINATKDEADDSVNVTESNEPEIKETKKVEEVKRKEPSKKENIFDNIQSEFKEAKNEKTVQMPEMPELPEIKLKDSHKKIIIISSVVIVLLLAILLLSTIFGLVVQNNNKIINGISIKNISVEGYTREEALDKINTIVSQKLEKNIVLKHNDYKIEISPKQIEATRDIGNSVTEAFDKGRNKNIFASNFETIVSFFSSTNINFDITYNEETFDAVIKEIESNLPDKFVDNSYYIDGNNLIISKGHDGYIVDSNKLKVELFNLLNNLTSNVAEIDIPVNIKKVEKINVNKIHEEIYKEAKNAYYTTNPYVIYPHVDGIDFDISIDEATNIVNTSTENEITIPLKIISPEITTNQIGTEAFPDELGSFYTTYSTGNVNRSTNIRLASEKIDGTVVMPDEVFSYNATVGQRTTAAGFKSAPVYSGGEVTNGIGGGICQVSSTLYNAVLYANLEIVERSNHGFNPGYVAVSRDATVSWGGPDFKFKNTRSYPIKIVCSGEGGRIDVQIFGLATAEDPEVEIQSYVTRWIAYSTITREDHSLEKGETKIVQNGSNGCRSVAYRILYKNGEEIDKELLSEDTYSPHNKIIAVGM